MVSVWATANHIRLARVTVDETSNEITAIHPQGLHPRESPPESLTPVLAVLAGDIGFAC